MKGGLRLATLGGVAVPGVLEGIANPGLAQILATQPTNLIQLLIVNEALGASVALDASGNGFNGSYNGVTCAQISAPGGGTMAALWDGLNDTCNAFSAGLASAFDNSTGTLLMFGRVSGAGVWTDSTARNLAAYKTDAGHSILIGRTTTNNQLRVRLYDGAQNIVTKSSVSPTDWFLLGLNYDSGLEGFYNGVSFGTDTINSGMSGTLDGAGIGCWAALDAGFWSGYGFTAALWAGIILSDPEHLAIAQAAGVA